MSLHPQPVGSIPAQTARVAHAAFPQGHPYLTLRDHLGTMFQDADCAALFPAWGYPGSPLGHLRQDKPGFPVTTCRYAAIGLLSCWLASQR
jgi:hypothetical protein